MDNIGFYQDNDDDDDNDENDVDEVENGEIEEENKLDKGNFFGYVDENGNVVYVDLEVEDNVVIFPSSHIENNENENGENNENNENNSGNNMDIENNELRLNSVNLSLLEVDKTISTQNNGSDEKKRNENENENEEEN